MAWGPRAGFYYALAAIPLTVAGMYGAEALDLTHTQKTIVAVATLAVALVLIGIGAMTELRAERQTHTTTGHRRRMIAIGGMLIFGIGFLGVAGAYFWPSTEDKISESTITSPHSRFQVTGYSLSRPIPDSSELPSIFTIDVINDGKIAGDKPMLNWNILAVQVPFSKDRLELEFESIYRDAIKTLPSNRGLSVISENKSGQYAFNANFINQYACNIIRNGDLTLYVICVLVWSDSTLENNWWWITEHCSWERKDLTVMHLCDDHNITYKRYIPSKIP
jgi:hypothetical protein